MRRVPFIVAQGVTVWIWLCFRFKMCSTFKPCIVNASAIRSGGSVRELLQRTSGLNGFDEQVLLRSARVPQTLLSAYSQQSLEKIRCANPYLGNWSRVGEGHLVQTYVDN